MLLGVWSYFCRKKQLKFTRCLLVLFTTIFVFLTKHLTKHQGASFKLRHKEIQVLQMMERLYHFFSYFRTRKKPDNHIRF